jgi:CRISPR-associated protein Csm5
VQVSTLTPLHIGNGVELLNQYDYAIYKGQTWRIDHNCLLEAQKVDDPRQLRLIAQSPPQQLLADADYRPGSPFFRYVLKGVPRATGEGAVLREQIKDVYDRPYLPGSSLKGALRTALAWTSWHEINPTVSRKNLGLEPPDQYKFNSSKKWRPNPKKAAYEIEEQIFGKKTSYDLLRALQISDCVGDYIAGSRLRVVNTQVLTQKSVGSPVALEAISSNTTFTGTLHIDKILFRPDAERILGFSNRRHWLDELMPRVQRYSLARLTELIKWFEGLEGDKTIAQFYRKLVRTNLAENQAFLQLGWGTGWDGTTFWTHLTRNKDLFEEIVGGFEMHKAAAGSPPRKSGDPFPRSRRAVMQVVHGKQAPAAPLGWVLLEITPLP